MKFLLIPALLVMGILMLPGALQAEQLQQITNLDELLASVKQGQSEQRARNIRREQQFLIDNKKQQALLEEARRSFQRRQKENLPLVSITQRNKDEIERLTNQLEDVAKDLGDLSNIFRQFSGDFTAVLQESMITAQFSERGERMRNLASPKGQVSIAEIEDLWLLVQTEMTEAGKIARFEAPVVSGTGASTVRPVLRIGTFSVYDGEKFLRYIPETGELLVLSRQPASRYRNAAGAFGASSGELMSVPVDPSRGTLLGMLSYTPSIKERIEQGGTIGRIIIALGAAGLLMALWRGVYLLLVSLRIRAQLAQLENPRVGNPLGRVLLSVQGVSIDEEELLQLKLDEAVLAEIPALERGNGVIKLLAATSPLLGLLGTVTGMILTFQAISLFGTGDPKLMAGGISQALVTTVLGLVVAIPLLFSHSVIAYMSRTVIQRLDEQCAGVLARGAESREREGE